MDNFVNQPKPRADRISHAKWESHRSIIIQKYKFENMSVETLVEYMRHEHDFCAT